MQHFCRNFLGFECFFNNPNWNRNIFSDFLLDFTQKFQKWPFSVNRGFWIRFRFGSVFEKSVIFGFGSVRVLEFSVGFSVFRVTDQPLVDAVCEPIFQIFVKIIFCIFCLLCNPQKTLQKFWDCSRLKGREVGLV